MRKKVITKRAPCEKIYKPPSKPSTRSQDRTFTPSPSPPTSPPRCDPMARTKNTPRFPASAKPTPPPKATPSKPASSKPGSSKPPSSKGKRPATEEPVPEPQQPRARTVPVRSQRGFALMFLLIPELSTLDDKRGSNDGQQNLKQPKMPPKGITLVAIGSSLELMEAVRLSLETLTSSFFLLTRFEGATTVNDEDGGTGTKASESASGVASVGDEVESGFRVEAVVLDALVEDVAESIEVAGASSNIGEREPRKDGKFSGATKQDGEKCEQRREESNEKQQSNALKKNKQEHNKCEPAQRRRRCNGKLPITQRLRRQRECGPAGSDDDKDFRNEGQI
nr:zinc finger CCCH domain-containing protein 18-like [Arachis hypogaea]